jgi:hypothetical protein
VLLVQSPSRAGANEGCPSTGSETQERSLTWKVVTAQPKKAQREWLHCTVTQTSSWDAAVTCWHICDPASACVHACEAHTAHIWIDICACM